MAHSGWLGFVIVTEGRGELGILAARSPASPALRIEQPDPNPTCDC